MSELKERILNGSVNVFLIGLPIALVLIFGEKFSLWINILAIGCLLIVSAVLASNIGDEYEGPKRVLHAFLGAVIALCLKTLAYPGHTTVIIMATILIVCTMDIIQRGQILWIGFLRTARLHFLGKFILLTTTLFVISLIIANFGSQKIWIPIAAALLIIILLFENNEYIKNRGLSLVKIEKVLFGMLLLTGIVSTSIQFRMVEIFWGGIKIWQGAITFTVIIIAVVALTVISKKRKKRKRLAALLKIRQENEAKQKELEEKSRKFREQEERARLEVANKLEEIERSEEALTAEDLNFLFCCDKDLGVKLIFQKNIDANNLNSHVIVSNHKKKIVWDAYLRDSLSLLCYAAAKKYDDEKLDKILELIKVIREDVYHRKTKESEYEGQVRLEISLREIENAAISLVHR